MKNLYPIVKLKQKTWLKSYIEMNTDLKKIKEVMLMNNTIFGKTMENVRQHRDIKLVTAERRRNYLVSEPNYHTTKLFTENLLAIEMKK